MSPLRAFPRQLPRLSSNVSRSFASQSNPIRIVEVGPRDGLQNEKTPLGVATKLELIRRLRSNGLTTIECGSFVSPKAVPQMSASSEILQFFNNTPPEAGTTHSYLVPNAKGMENFLSLAPDARRNEIAIFASASEGFSQRNLRCSVAESLDRFREVARQAKEKGFRVRGYVSMIISCPYTGPTPVTDVAKVTRELLNMGCYEVSLGDTIGVGTPGQVRTLIRNLKAEDISPLQLAGHFHDTYGMGVANVAAAIEEGVSVFDASVAGLGGCPYAKGASGNLATEDLVWFLEGEGVKTGIDLEGLAETGGWISGVLGRANASNVGRAVLAKVAEKAQKVSKL